METALSHRDTIEVRDRCLCFRAQRTARALARRFDNAFRPFGINQGQFSLLVALNRPEAPTIGEIAAFLAMDRTTLTAALKPLSRRNLVQVIADPNDARARRLHLTNGGRALLAAALPVWRDEHDALDSLLLTLEGGLDIEALRGGIGLLGQADRLAPNAPIDGERA